MPGLQSDLIGVTMTLCTYLILPVTPHGGHHHHKSVHAEDRPKSLHDPKVSQDVDHIKEHYQGRADFNESTMTTEELEFHYFKLHDFDNNTKLDGLEILAALTDIMPYEKAEPEKYQSPEDKKLDPKVAELKYYTDIIDTVLADDDIDNDGYLTYMEYVLARKREEAHEELQKAKKRRDRV